MTSGEEQGNSMNDPLLWRGLIGIGYLSYIHFMNYSFLQGHAFDFSDLVFVLNCCCVQSRNRLTFGQSAMKNCNYII
jgi:hypothetical protein